jgi:DNA-binding beta-propeller fold protein YncE
VGLRFEGYIELPEHRGGGGFDHAAAHRGLRRLHVAHTANDAVDLIDLDSGRYLESIGQLTGVAGVFVEEATGCVFTPNRGEDTVALFDARHPNPLVTVPIGRGPNGLAFDPVRRTLLVANVGDPADPASRTVSMVDTDQRVLSASIPVDGRTRWTVFDPVSDRFYVNIAGSPDVIILDPTLHQLYVAVGNPGLIEVFDSRELEPIGTVVTEPGARTIGIDLDRHRVYAFLPATHRAAVFAARA